MNAIADLRMPKYIALVVLLVGCAGCSWPIASVHAATQSDIAGEYWNGTGISGLLELRVQQGGAYCFTRSSDVGVLDEGCGTTYLDDRWVQFIDDGHKRDSMTKGWWRLVEWGERRYLVQEDILLEFVNWVNLGFEPRTEESGLFLFRKGDAARDVSGEPSLPEEWRRQLLPPTLTGRVVQIFEAGLGKLNIGEGEGLRPGLLLLAETDDGWFEVEVVTTVSDASVVRVESASDGPLVVGQRVISRWPRSLSR